MSRSIELRVCAIVGGHTAVIASEITSGRHQNVLDATVPEFVHDAQPEFGAFRGLDPNAQTVFSPSAMTSRSSTWFSILFATISLWYLLRDAKHKLAFDGYEDLVERPTLPEPGR